MSKDYIGYIIIAILFVIASIAYYIYFCDGNLSIGGFHLKASTEDSDGTSDDNTRSNIDTTTPSITSSLQQIQGNSQQTASGNVPPDCVGHWAEKYIVKLVESSKIHNATACYQDGTFRPENIATRVELVVFAMKGAMANVDAYKNQKTSFIDDSQIPEWAKAYIVLAQKSNLIKGYEDRTFRPLSKVTRKEAVTMMVRSYKLENLPFKPLDFIDANQIPEWAKQMVSAAVQVGMISGYPDKTFRPDRQVTRAEITAMLVKAMEKRQGR